MEPYYDQDDVTIYHADCLQTLSELQPKSAQLVFVDPPYNIGIFSKMPAETYLNWCQQWIQACDRVLAANGAFWVSHSKPDVLIDISRLIEQAGRKRLNWITWDKYNNTPPGQQFILNRTKRHLQGKRTFDSDAEYLVFHADEGDWVHQCDRERGFIFEPLRTYLNSEKNRAGLTTRQVAEHFQKKTGSRTVTGMASHWFSRVQWTLPTKENYYWLREIFAHNNTQGNEYLRREYEDLRREYEDLRREYEDLRYTFNNPGLVSSVWQFPPALKNGHPTPKPVALLERIILATTNEGDLVVDPMMGSGKTAVACAKTGRQFKGIEIKESYCEIAVSSLAQLPLL